MAFKLSSEFDNGIGKVILEGELDGLVAESFRDEVSKLSAQKLRRLVLDMKALDYMSSAGLRVLVFARQKMSGDVDIYLVGASESVRETIEMTGFHYSVIMLDEYDPAQLN
ncbi:MAG: STAS domain-containing protein [Chloroflexota bacterium]